MKKLPLDKIEFPFRVRYRMDQATVDEYAQAMQDGAIFPPLEVFRPKGTDRYICGDGEHRWYGAEKIKRKTIACTIHIGDEHDALRHALSANAEHGLRRTSADKRKCVLIALNDPTYDDLTIRAVSELCRVSHNMVHYIKQEINEQAEKMKRAAAEPEGKKEKKKKKPEPPTQDETDLMELRDAIKMIRAFPYSGEAAYEKLELTKADLEEIGYVSDWLHALIRQLL